MPSKFYKQRNLAGYSPWGRKSWSQLSSHTHTKLTVQIFIIWEDLIVWITTNWKILQEIGIPEHLICPLRNLYAGQEATVRTVHGTTDLFQIRKGVHQVYILSLCLFNLYAENIIRNVRLDETQARIKIARRNIKTSDMQMTPPLWQKGKRN